MAEWGESSIEGIPEEEIVISDYEAYWNDIREPFGEWDEDDCTEFRRIVQMPLFKKGLQVVLNQTGKIADSTMGMNPHSNPKDLERFLRAQGSVHGQNTMIDNLLRLAEIEEE